MYLSVLFGTFVRRVKARQLKTKGNKYYQAYLEQFSEHVEVEVNFYDDRQYDYFSDSFQAHLKKSDLILMDGIETPVA